MPSSVTVVGHRSYTCRAGESWDLLAGQAYGYETMADVIIAANPGLSDVLLFDGGEVIDIPVVERVETPDTLPPWRR